jgi:hypothetical protein
MVALSIDFNEDHYNAIVQASGNPRHWPARHSTAEDPTSHKNENGIAFGN